MSSSVHVDNKKRHTSSWKRINTGTKTHINCKKMYPINFTVTRKVFCLSLHYSGANSYLFVNGKEIVKSKAENSATVATPLCLGNISRDWSTDNIN